MSLIKLAAPQGKGSTLFIHLILGGVSSCLWLSEVFVSQVQHIKAYSHSTIDFLVVTEELMGFESTLSAFLYAAPQTSFMPASETVACILSLLPVAVPLKLGEVAVVPHADTWSPFTGMAIQSRR